MCKKKSAPGKEVWGKERMHKLPEFCALDVFRAKSQLKSVSHTLSNMESAFEESEWWWSLALSPWVRTEGGHGVR